MNETPELNVYIASAGAGKTHTLTGEYLRLALSESDNPRYFSHIQAVTFTNKATAEMKERILKELYKLAYTCEQSPYQEQLLPIFKGNTTKLEIQARKVLWNMLLFYSDFRVKTIDSFFQEIIRSFIRELDLTGGYHVELDGAKAVSIAIDQLLSSQDKQSSTEKLTFRWLERMVNEMMREGKGHNIRYEMGKLGDELLKEDIKELIQSKTLPSPEDIIKLQTAFEELVQEAMQMGKEGMEALEQMGLSVEDFSYGKAGAISLMRQLASGEPIAFPARAQAVLDSDGESGLFKKGIAASIQSRLLDYFHKYMRPTYELYQRLQIYYLTAKVAQTYLSSYGLIGAINESLQEVNRNENTLLLSDAPSLINAILKGGDGVPFIYEKLGERINHQMIDEFQDTSSLQYNNFRPILEENLAKGYDNLIVGDVKQSIYRWRNSDSAILASRIFDDFTEAKKITLKQNWRSAPEIIHFNNALYRHLAQQFTNYYDLMLQGTNQYKELQESTQVFIKRYAEVEQEIPTKNLNIRGQVVVYNSNESTISDETEQEELPTNKTTSPLEQIAEVILEIQKRGYKASDIAILTRTNKDITQIVEQLLTYPKENIPEGCSLNFVSEEALIISRSPLVRFIIASLRYANNLNDSVARHQWSELYRGFSNEIIPPKVEEFIASIGRKSLYEVLEGIYHHFSYLWQGENSRKELAYRLKLLDMALAFQQDKTADLGDFLAYWDERGSTEKITSNPEDDAIQILTIHKSKGLGFPVVLLPFVNWELEEGRNIIWSEIEEEPFNIVKKIPIPAKQELLNTFFAKDYLNELINQGIDALNLLYVATTRSERELHLWIPSENRQSKEKSKKRKKNNEKQIGRMVSLVLEQIEESKPSLFIRYSTDKLSPTDIYPQIGKRDNNSHQPEVSNSLILEAIPSYEAQGRIAILREGLEHFDENSQLHYGRLMHRILDRIKTTSDIDKAIEYFGSRGDFSEEDRPKIETQIRDLVMNPATLRWFNGSGRILTEIPIVGGGMLGSRRPDRLVLYPDNAIEVIDYKFGSPRRSHFSQVKTYMTLLKQMGFSSIRGYIWYIPTNNIKEVH